MGRQRATITTGRLALATALFLATVAGAPARVDAASRWAISPTVDAGVGALLFGVSCVDATFCVGVGTEAPSDSSSAALIESWDGHDWSVMPSPDVDGELLGISCVSRTRCVAVGFQSGANPGTNHTLVETWDGASWTVVPSPDHADSVDNQLASVSCASASSCVAVGLWIREGSFFSVTLTERWDGTEWKVGARPEFLPPGNTGLNGVSCPSPGVCFAVGSAQTSNGLLIETLTGRHWSIATAPDIGGPTTRGVLNAIDCASASSCVATGSFFTGSGPARALAVAWNGSSWSALATEDHGLVDTLGSVSCATAQHCVAAGESQGPSSLTQSRTLIEVWNGATWKRVGSPNPSHPERVGALEDVSCASTRVCVAVGFGLLHDGHARTLALVGR